jgi:hypothetical protein
MRCDICIVICTVGIQFCIYINAVLCYHLWYSLCHAHFISTVSFNRRSKHEKIGEI